MFEQWIVIQLAFTLFVIIDNYFKEFDLSPSKNQVLTKKILVSVRGRLDGLTTGRLPLGDERADQREREQQQEQLRRLRAASLARRSLHDQSRRTGSVEQVNILNEMSRSICRIVSDSCMQLFTIYRAYQT